VIRVSQIKAHDRTVDARRVYDGRDERPLVSEGCDDTWKQLCEERRPMLSKACGLQAGHGKQFTGMMKSDGTSIWDFFSTTFMAAAGLEADLLATIDTLWRLEAMAKGDAADATEEQWHGALDRLLEGYTSLKDCRLPATVPLAAVEFVDRGEDPDGYLGLLAQDCQAAERTAEAKRAAMACFRDALQGAVAAGDSSAACPAPPPPLLPT